MALIELHTAAGLRNAPWRTANKIYYAWCKENCKEWWCCDVLSNTTRWTFKHKSDAMGFKLRWL